MQVYGFAPLGWTLGTCLYRACTGRLAKLHARQSNMEWHRTEIANWNHSREVSQTKLILNLRVLTRYSRQQQVKVRRSRDGRYKNCQVLTVEFTRCFQNGRNPGSSQIRQQINIDSIGYQWLFTTTSEGSFVFCQPVRPSLCRISRSSELQLYRRQPSRNSNTPSR